MSRSGPLRPPPLRARRQPRVAIIRFTSAATRPRVATLTARTHAGVLGRRDTCTRVAPPRCSESRRRPAQSEDDTSPAVVRRMYVRLWRFARMSRSSRRFACVGTRGGSIGSTSRASHVERHSKVAVGATHVPRVARSARSSWPTWASTFVRQDEPPLRRGGRLRDCSRSVSGFVAADVTVPVGGRRRRRSLKCSS